MPRSRANRFQTITTQGGLLPPDVLKRVADLDGKLAGLTPEAYDEPEGFRLNEAIQRDWTQAQRHWKDFQRAREEIGVHDDTGELITRDRWVKPLLKLLGFGTLGVAKTRTLGSEEDGSLQSFRITHFWQGEGAHEVPIHVTGFKQDLDRRPSGEGGGTNRIAPHGLVQLYLNRVDESLWAFCTNGLRWRILRDHAAISRPSLVEFDLEAMMDGEVYADFAIFWLCCHATSVQGQTPASCRLEQWCRVGEQQGTRVLEQLRRGVEDAIVALGRGFLAHPQNDELRRRLQSGELSTQELYRRLLRHVYRLLFLMVAEDRQLLHPPAPEGDPAAAKAHAAACRLYDRHYSLRRLRELSAGYTGTRHGDLWEMLGRTFRYLGMDGGCPPLALPGLGSFLWDPASTEGLNASPPPGFETAADEPDAGGSPAAIANEHLLEAIRALAFTEEQGVRRAVDYRNLGSEELGSVYEGLLELVPTVTAVASEVEHLFSLETADGNERKTSGSYYTPDSLVQLLLDSALEPVISDRLSGTTSKEDAERALLSITVCDPACGSGHFLIAAAHRLARRLAEIRTGEPEPAMAERQAALRDVIRHCIYGIDINPMAAELCKVSLWMESIAPGQPLTFLDHHIVVGNSLLGVTPTMLQEGIPDEFFRKGDGDHPKTCVELGIRNKKERASRIGRQGLLPFKGFDGGRALAEAVESITRAAEATVAAVAGKQESLLRLQKSDSYRRLQIASDAWAAAAVWEKSKTADGRLCPTDGDVMMLLAQGDSGSRDNRQLDLIHRYAASLQLLHPQLAFPEIFPADTDQAGGFDVIVGNPPFLNQLESATAVGQGPAAIIREITKGAVRGYADVSAAFLLKSVSWCRNNGRVALVQPQSLLATKDSGPVRRSILGDASMVMLWVSNAHVFEGASVFTCAPVLEKAGERKRLMIRFGGGDFHLVEPVEVDNDELALCPTWSHLAAAASGIPEVRVDSAGTVGDIARATADFRDQYYGLDGFLIEDSEIARNSRNHIDRDFPPVVTTGLIDLAVCRWGQAGCRILKKKWTAPRVDRGAMISRGELGQWMASRLVPKVILATQTKTLEAFVDTSGRFLPSIPIISVIPFDVDDIWLVGAVLCSPVCTALAMLNYGGAALSSDAIKLSAKQVALLPLPADKCAWARAAGVLQQVQSAEVETVRLPALLDFGKEMCAAYGLHDDRKVFSWWWSRLGFEPV